MPAYRKGEQTYAELLHAARELFYQKGYKATYCTEITEAVGANPGLIHYYFKSKANIALQVLAYVYNNLMEVSATNFSDLPFLTRIALETELMWILIRKDDNFCRFMSEIAAEHIPSELEMASSFKYLDDINQYVGSKLSREQIRMLARLAFASEYELILFYARKEYDISGDDYMRQDARIFLQLFSIPAEEVEQAIQEAEDILKDWKLEITEAFEIRIGR